MVHFVLRNKTRNHGSSHFINNLVSDTIIKISFAILGQQNLFPSSGCILMLDLPSQL